MSASAFKGHKSIERAPRAFKVASGSLEVSVRAKPWRAEGSSFGGHQSRQRIHTLRSDLSVLGSLPTMSDGLSYRTPQPWPLSLRPNDFPCPPSLLSVRVNHVQCSYSLQQHAQLTVPRKKEYYVLH
jgi:hypothetical protein